MKLWKGKNRGRETGPGFVMQDKRVYNFFDLTTLGVGTSLGVGVYVLLGDLSKNVAGPAVVVSVAVAGITAMFAGLCLAEFGVRFLKADTAYSYSYSCNGETVAFVLGWALILEYVAGAASITKGVIGFVDALTENKITEFLTGVAPLNLEFASPYFDFISFSIIVFLTFFLAFEIKDAHLLKTIFTACNLGLLLIVLIAGSLKADINNWDVQELTADTTEKSFVPFGFLSVIKGAAMAFYGFIGFEIICISGYEIENRQQNLPLGIASALLIATGAYLGIGTILTLMGPYYELNERAALPFVFERVGWTALKWVITVGVFFGCQNSLFGAMCPLPRIMCAMADDSLLFHFLGNTRPRLKTPVTAIAVGGFLTAVAGGMFTFRQLVNLTVIVTLFVCTIIAIDVLLSRYTLANEELSEYGLNFPQNKTVSLKAVAQNYFKFTTKTPTKLTEQIISGNIILFCLSSLGLSLVFMYYTQSYLILSPKSLLPACLVLLVFLILVSMVCQPKSRKELPYKAPLVPFLPCLSIFLNIFLMTTFDAATWIRFSVWMGLGVVPHLIWFNLKRCKSQVGENSVYEINKMNELKLSESIWKIKSEKKSFYEGAVNPVFCEEPEDSSVEPAVKENGKIKHREEKASLQLKQAEVIQTADLVLEEKANSLKSEMEFEVVSVNNEPVGDGLESLGKFPVDERVHYQCVAEIHTEEEILQESLALEMFENSYKFLGDVEEEIPVEEDSLPKSVDFESSTQKSASDYVGIKENGEVTEEVVPLPPPLPEPLVVPELYDDSIEDHQQAELKEVQNLMEYVDEDINNNEENFTTLGDFNKEIETHQQTTDDTQSQPQENNEEQIINLIADNIYDTQKFSTRSNSNGVIQKENLETRAEKQDDQNKRKDFKEKLNELLKNQVNINSTFTKSFFISNSMSKKDEDIVSSLKSPDLEDPLYRRAKTLNKSEIRNKLELLLSKGPPKRASLSNSFNIKTENIEEENDLETITEKEIIPNGTSSEEKSERI